MFHKPIDNQWLPSLLYEENQDKQNFINDLLKDIIHNKSMRSLYLPLLPEEIVLNKVPYAIQFYLIDDLIHESLTNEKIAFIVTLKDVSEAIALKTTLDEERNQLEMLVEVYRNSNAIKAAIKDYHHFSEQIADLLTQKIPDQTKLKIIFRQVHTFKGMFSQMKFVESVKHLHAIEDKLNDIEKTGLYQGLKHIDFNHVLNDDLEFFKDKLGLDISSLQEEIVVKKSKLIELEAHLKTYGNHHEIKGLLEELQSIRAKSFKSLLDQYDHYIQDLSEKLNKPMDTFVVLGDDILVDHEIYRDFSNSLIHVIRNMMDHGIESQEERQASQKPLSGHIKAIVNLRDDMIELTLENDGQAIDLESIKQSAIQKGYDIKSYSDQAILQLIFEPDISTKDSVTKLSGRGVGLASVKYELERLGGRVDITSSDQKTTFTFKLPLYKGILSKEQLEKTFGRSVALYLDRYESKFSVSDQLCTLNDQWCGVKLPFTGLYQGDLLIYFEKENLIEFVKKHGFNEGDWQDYSKEVLKEVANTMIGNGLALLPGAGNLVELGLPEKIDISPETLKGYMIELEYMRIMIKLL
jgi:two-component system chemotaxis sensor kinase CheA